MIYHEDFGRSSGHFEYGRSYKAFPGQRATGIEAALKALFPDENGSPVLTGGNRQPCGFFAIYWV